MKNYRCINCQKTIGLDESANLFCPECGDRLEEEYQGRSSRLPEQGISPDLSKSSTNVLLGENVINSLTSDLKPDSWVTFYLFYFNQGLGSDASFQFSNRLVHIFVGNLMSAENNEAILEAVDKKHELAAGELMHILTQLSDYDLGLFKSSAGAALVIENQSGKVESTFFKNEEDIKAFVMNLRSQGAKQLH